MSVYRAFGILAVLVSVGFALTTPACDTITNQLCASNTTLYQECIKTVILDGDNSSLNESQTINCAYGCSNNACNPSTLEKWEQNGLLFLGVLIALLLVLFISHRGKKIGF